MSTTSNNSTNKISLYDQLDNFNFVLANSIHSEVDENLFQAMYEISEREIMSMSRDEQIEELNLDNDASDNELNDAIEAYCQESEGFTIYQTFVVDQNGHEILKKYGELTWYNEEFGVHLWGVMHFGTAWSYVMGDQYPIDED